MDLLDKLIEETEDHIGATRSHLRTLEERHQTLITLKEAANKEAGEDG